jgi:hypothetical protein
MRTLANVALTIWAAALFAGCGGSRSPIGAPGAMPQSNAIATHAKRSGLCPSQYIECIKLTYGSPFVQEWCVLPGTGYFPSLDFTRAQCKKFKSGTFEWSAKVYRAGTERRVGVIAASFDPSSGDPTELTITERQQRHSSGGKIVYRVQLEACQVISGNTYCSSGPDRIGIATSN